MLCCISSKPKSVDPAMAVRALSTLPLAGRMFAPSGLRQLRGSACSLRTASHRKMVTFAMADVQDKVKELAASNGLVVFSKTYCPYCTNAKKLFSNKGAKAMVLELDNMGEEGAAIQAALTQMTGSRTVPSVWIGNKYVGGCDDSMALDRSGKLDGMLKEAGAL